MQRQIDNIMTKAIIPPKIPHAHTDQVPPDPPPPPPPPVLILVPPLPPPLPPRAALTGLHRELSTHRPPIQHPLRHWLLNPEQPLALVLTRLVEAIPVVLNPLSRFVAVARVVTFGSSVVCKLSVEG